MNDFIGKYVITRNKNAGVHMGFLVSLNGTAGGMCGVLKNSSRLFNWNGAFSLNEISINGVSEDSKISEKIQLILLTEIIEILPCTEKAQKNLMKSRNNPS